METLKDKTRAYVDILANEVVERWETFGAPENWAMAELDVWRHVTRNVRSWSKDALECHAETFGDMDFYTTDDAVSQGAALVEWLAPLTTARLGELCGMPREIAL